MKIAAIDRTPVGVSFHKEQTRDGLFLYWDNADHKFYTSFNKPGMPTQPVSNPKYACAKDEAEAGKLATEFFAELGEGD